MDIIRFRLSAINVPGYIKNGGPGLVMGATGESICTVAPALPVKFYFSATGSFGRVWRTIESAKGEAMIRKAQIGDIKEIQKLLTHYASKGDMLSRSLSELYEAVRDFYVYEADGRL